MPLVQLVLEAQAQKLLARPVRYVANEIFGDASPEDAAFWRGPMPGMDDYLLAKAKLKAPVRSEPQMRDQYLWPILNKDQEQHLFRKMNFLRHLSLSLRDQIRDGDLDAVVEAQLLQDEADAIRLHLFSANRRLVVSVAKKFHNHLGREFREVLADGDLSLLAAVEKFDYSFGFKFSTYAYWSILRNYTRAIPSALRRQCVPLFPFDHQEDLILAPDDDTSARLEAETCVHNTLSLLIRHLEPRERIVIRLRTGMGSVGKPLTLEQVGRQFGLTKERIRQIEHSARLKLALIAQNTGIQSPV